MELNSLKQNFHCIVIFWNTTGRSVFMELVTKTLEIKSVIFQKVTLTLASVKTLRIHLIITNMISEDKNNHFFRIEFLFPTINRY